MELEKSIISGINLHIGRQKNTVCLDSGRKVATTFGANKEEYTKLFVASLDLLEALQSIVGIFDEENLTNGDVEKIRKAEAAINKALNGK